MENKNVIQYATEFIKKTPKLAWKNLGSILDLDSTEFGDVSADEIIGYAVKYKLMTSEDLARFMVKMLVEQITAIHEGFYSIKKDHKNVWKSKLECASDEFKYALDNPHKKDAELDTARHRVMECIRVFKNDIIEHIAQIRQIENQSIWKWYLLSWVLAYKCRKESSFAFETVKRLMDAYRLLFIISAHTQDNSTSLVKNFEEIKNEIMEEDNCMLMAAYSKDEEVKEFWYGLSDSWDELKNFQVNCTDQFGIEDEEDDETSFWDEDIDGVDLDNIVFIK